MSQKLKKITQQGMKYVDGKVPVELQEVNKFLFKKIKLIFSFKDLYGTIIFFFKFDFSFYLFFEKYSY